jgi:hypothetical protein
MPIYYSRGYPFNNPLRARGGFYPWIPAGMGFFPTFTYDLIDLAVIEITNK